MMVITGTNGSLAAPAKTGTGLDLTLTTKQHARIELARLVEPKCGKIPAHRFRIARREPDTESCARRVIKAATLEIRSRVTPDLLVLQLRPKPFCG